MVRPDLPAEGVSTPAGRVSRRTLLGAVGAAAGLTAATAGGVILGGGAAPAPASAHGSLVGYNEIGDQGTWLFNRATDQIEPIGRYTFLYDQTFYNRLESWLAFHYVNTPGNWVKPYNVYISHIHRDTSLGNGSLSYHAYGRAMDLCELWMYRWTTPTYLERILAFNARGQEINQGSVQWKWYWGGVASLMYHFNYVLHYYYDSGHRDHVHADNAVSGSGSSTFSTSSATQKKFGQAALRYVWGYGDVVVDGAWGPISINRSNQALARMGRSGSLTSSQANWLAFCEGTTRFGTGKQSY